MRLPPSMPYDRLQIEWQRPKSFGEWRRYFAWGPNPFRERLADFCRWVQYFCAADLAYIDAGVMERPSPEIIIALEHAASNLDNDSELLAALWLTRDMLGEREARWHALARLMVLLAQQKKELGHGST